jgi:hypothetical protein
LLIYLRVWAFYERVMPAMAAMHPGIADGQRRLEGAGKNGDRC